MNPSGGDAGYRPISGLALGGFLASCAFAVLALVGAVAGAIQKTPIFFPLETTLIAIVGFLLCYAGHRQIAAAEGTRAGAALARYGMAIALFSGFGYLAYSLSIGIGVGMQADAFVMGPVEPDSGFFARLKKSGKEPGEANVAFTFTLPAPSRTKLRPDDDAGFKAAYDAPGPQASAGTLTMFRHHPMVQCLRRAGDDARIESLGVREWTHEKQSYRVVRNYRIHSPEAVLDVALQLESTEPEAEGEKRKWFVNVQRSDVPRIVRTTLGDGVEELRKQSRAFIEGELLTPRPPELKGYDLPGADRTDWLTLFPDNSANLYGKVNIVRDHCKKAFRDLLQSPNRMAMSLTWEQKGWPIWDRDAAGRFRIRQTLSVRLEGFDYPGAENKKHPGVMAEGPIVVRTAQPMPDALVSAPPPAIAWEVESVALERSKAAGGP